MLVDLARIPSDELRGHDHGRKAIQRGVEKGLQEGHRQKALEDARRMREHGISWEIVTDVTGIVPADLA